MTASIWGGAGGTTSVSTPEQGFENRNILRNGDMRASGFDGALNNAFLATVQYATPVPIFDNWQVTGVSGAGVIVYSQGSPIVSSSNLADQTYYLNGFIATADAVLSAGRSYHIQQAIRWNDFNKSLFGTSTAKTLTLSFWVQSTIVGTHSGSLKNVEGNRSYPFSYTINATNTWELKTISIPGDTVPNWFTTSPNNNPVVAFLMFSLGAASGLKGTANAWSAGSFFAASGSVNVISTVSALFRLTQVQLEYGSVQTPFAVLNYEQGAMESATYNPYLQAPFRNRIINGDMRFDQRYNGGANSINLSQNIYVLDRWCGFGYSADGVFTLQRQAGGPKGFDYYQRINVTTADASIASNQSYILRQFIEGNNVGDLNWGSANAKTVTLSFWARSSLTGAFGAVVAAGDSSWTYPFVYFINNANTWEYKTIVIPGPTSGTFPIDTSAAIQLSFAVGCGSGVVSGAPFAWINTSLYGVSGTVNLISTLSATLDFTGVQFEPGSVATPYEKRSHGVELALCQRYFEIINFSGFYVPIAGAGQMRFPVAFKVTKRAAPIIGMPSATNAAWNSAGAGITPSPFISYGVGVDGFSIDGIGTNIAGFQTQSFSATADY